MAMFVAMGLAVGLVACDNHFDQPTIDSQGEEPDTNSQEQVSPPVNTPKGPHGSRHDPHENLPADKHAQVALQHWAEGRPAVAIDTLNQAIAKYPNSAALYGIRGSLYLEQKSSAAALADLNKAVELDPHDAGFLTNRAQAYRHFGRTEEAMADLDSAIELDGGFVAARFNRGSLNFNAGNFSQALTDFDACIIAEPKAAAPYFNRASVHDAMGNRKQAIADLKHFLDIATSKQWKETAKALLNKWESSSKPDIKG